MFKNVVLPEPEGPVTELELGCNEWASTPAADAMAILRSISAEAAQ